MSILLNTLSANGLLLTPQAKNFGVLPSFGLARCSKTLLAFSPLPKLVKKIEDRKSFSEGEDIDIAGMQLKGSGKKLCFVPQELAPFTEVLRACIDNEFACDPHADQRQFSLTITRCDVVAGQGNRSSTAWHQHLPNDRIERREKTQVTRNYVVADQCGTEFLSGMRKNFCLSDASLAPTHRLPEWHLGVFSSFSLHRTPRHKEDGRRTVLVFISSAPGAQSIARTNPMIRRLANADHQQSLSLMNEWRQVGRAFLHSQRPSLGFDYQLPHLAA